MSKNKSLKFQAIAKLQKMAAYGTSKHQDKAQNGGKPMLGKIYSHSTMENYQAAAVQFTTWAKEAHGCRTLEEAQAHTGEYLQQRQAAGLSAWTVRRDAAALGKLYQVPTTALGADLPTRHRADVTQHRGPVKDFKESKYQGLADLCRSTGLRRSEVAALRPEDVRMDGGRCLVTVQQGKGGKSRTVTALDNTPARLAREAAAAGRDKVIDRIPCRAPVHMWRAEFAQKMYDNIARPIVTVPPEERYCCRSDRAGTHYDKAAMQQVSEALGHSRLDVVTSYIK